MFCQATVADNYAEFANSHPYSDCFRQCDNVNYERVVYLLAHESNLHSEKRCLLISADHTAEFSAVGLYNHVGIY